MRILLTGATGFFGRALLRHWSALAGPPVVVGLSRRPERFLADYPEFARLDWFRPMAGDVTDSRSLRDVPDFDHVLHAATDSTLGPQLQRLQLFVDTYVHLELL